ncbi:amino acid hydroxylase [Nocardia veterana]|uniref:Amino acid hydroxylase n=1 Tax=Nocardia veterana TaxID=132249 RepID=A0A7X6LZZ8_9NOCA|nr:amino acid hydroxylase [Nocardia veterana]NKY87765.1 amino acid hydroxylase [Nocardia veterana]
MTVGLDLRSERERVARACRPGQPVPEFAYSSAENALWSRVFATLRSMHEQLACADYRHAARLVRLPADRVPQLGEVSRTLVSLTGFRLAPAIGSQPGRLFYGPMADGILHATPDVRPVTEQAFSPDPDVIHELVGHAVILADPEFAELYRCFGRAANEATADEARMAIARLFWFTLEVGVVAEQGRPRAYGAAILSSVTEMESFVTADLREFRIADILASDIDDSICQPVLFVADSIGRMMTEVKNFLRTRIGS